MIETLISIASMVLLVLVTIEWMHQVRRRRSGRTVTLTFRIDKSAIHEAILRELESQWKGKA